MIYPHNKATTYLNSIASKIPSSIYMWRNLDQYKTNVQERLIGNSSIHGLDSRKKTSTRFLRMMPQSRAVLHRSLIMHVKQQPTRTLETIIQTQIQYKNNITAR